MLAKKPLSRLLRELHGIIHVSLAVDVLDPLIHSVTEPTALLADPIKLERIFAVALDAKPTDCLVMLEASPHPAAGWTTRTITRRRERALHRMHGSSIEWTRETRSLACSGDRRALRMISCHAFPGTWVGQIRGARRREAQLSMCARQRLPVWAPVRVRSARLSQAVGLAGAGGTRWLAVMWQLRCIAETPRSRAVLVARRTCHLRIGNLTAAVDAAAHRRAHPRPSA